MKKQQGALSNTPESAQVVAAFFCFVPRVTECCSKIKGRIKKVLLFATCPLRTTGQRITEFVKIFEGKHVTNTWKHKSLL